MIKSVKDFGAIGNGIHDDFNAFQKALDSGEKKILIPMGIYCISETLLVHSNTEILADKGAKIVMKSKRRRKRNEFLLSNADVVNGNKNIKIRGGIWDGNNQMPENKKPDLFDKEGYSGAMLNFVNIDGLVIDNMVLANSVTFYVRMSKVHNFRITDIDFVSDEFGENQDGLHFGGDVKHGYVKNIRALSWGQTNDDMLALNADDSIERVENLDLVRDAIEDIIFENIYCECCHTIIRMLSVTAPIRNLKFKNIYGGFRCNAINADAARYCRTPLFEEGDYPDGAGKIENIYFENFTCIPNFDPNGRRMPPEAALKFESQMDNFEIKNFTFIEDEEHKGQCHAIAMKNVKGEKVTIDKKVYEIYEKSDRVELGEFKDIKIDKI